MAERTAIVNVVGDAKQLLRLEPSDGPNGQYARLTEEGLLELDMSNSAREQWWRSSYQRDDHTWL